MVYHDARPAALLGGAQERHCAIRPGQPLAAYLGLFQEHSCNEYVKVIEGVEGLREFGRRMAWREGGKPGIQRNALSCNVPPLLLL
jgi:hypothetical protein